MEYPPLLRTAMNRLFTPARLILFFGLINLLFAGAARAQQSIYEDYTFTTFAGPNEAGAGWKDGPADMARFGTPAAVAQDAAGNIYVADPRNHTIRKITPGGVVTTVAGSTGLTGSRNGIGEAARFNTPYGIAVDSAGNLFVADTGNSTIRKISPSGLVTTFAGLAGVTGATNGPGNTARFFNPYGVMVDGSNNVYVADTFNNTIRVITPAGVVSTLAGKATVSGSDDKTGTAATFNRPVSLAMDSSGNIYVADTGNDTIRKIAPNTAVTTLAGAAGVSGTADGTNGTARFNNPYGMTVDSADNIYVVDTFNHTIRKITLAGVVTTPIGAAGVSGSADGVGHQARFNSPTGITAGHGTNLVVADFSNSSIRQILDGATVVTLAGLSGGPGGRDGSAGDALFNFPAGTAVDAGGNVYVADEQNHAIRKITPLGDVSTFAGIMGVAGSHDDTRLNATFNRPLGLAFDGAGNLYVADTHNNTIRKITADGTVSTVAGLAGTSGSSDGTGTNVLFNSPFSLAIDTQTNIYVADTFNQTIRKITPDGVVSTLAGKANVQGTNNATGTNATFSFPEGIAVDPDGNVFVTDDGNSSIRKITAGGVVTTFAGISGGPGAVDGVDMARFNFPFGLAIDASRNLYVADVGNHTVRKITPAGAVTTLGGLAGVFGNVEGTGSDARMASPEGIAVGSDGTLYVSDRDNHVIRKGYPAPSDRPTVDLAGARVGVTRHFGVTNLTTTSWSWSIIRYPSAASAQFSSATSMNPTFTPDAEDTYLIRFQGWDNSGHTVIRILTLYADDTPPIITITNPVSGQFVSNSVVTIRGVVTDNLSVSNVWVQINSGAWTKAAGNPNWTLNGTLLQGTNAIRAYAEDVAGNVSPTNEIAVFYIPSAPLTVQLNGGGTVTPNLNGVLLELGRTYSITAVAGPGSEFVDWTGSLTTTNSTLTFVMQSNLTFVANFTDPVKPTLVITSPQKSSHVSNAVFTATGTAADNGQLAAVWYKLNGGDWIQATNTTNWTAGLALSDSANTLQAYAIDTFGNISITNSVLFTYIPSSRITVLMTGQGTLTPNYNGWFLETGRSYSMTAKAGFNYIFSKWTDALGNTLTTSPTLAFTVQSNITFRANFIVNPFAPMTGPFAGLFYDTNNIAVTNSGTLAITLSGLGSFSAKGQLSSGQKLSFSGHFESDSVFSNAVPVKGSTPFIVQLRLSAANDGQITGSIGNSGWTSPLLAVRAFYSLLNPAPQNKLKYTLVIPGGDDSTVQPAGAGFGTVSVDVSGNVKLSGVLADGAKVTQKTFINKQGVWPLYASPYKGKGAIFGWMRFVTNQSDSDLTGLLNWIKLPQSGGYPAGFAFTDGITPVGSIYTFTNGVPLLNLPSGGVTILQQGNPVQNSTNNLTLGTDNKLISANGLKAAIATSSGLFKGTATLGNGSSVPINGVLLQKQNAAYGFFLSNGQSGSVYLGP
jgi:sugar lactone lactonase YvrE